jgi:hypothetical protein
MVVVWPNEAKAETRPGVRLRRWQQLKKAQRVQGEAVPPTFSRFPVRRLPDGFAQRRPPSLVRETDAASWIPLVLRNEPNVRVPGGTKKRDAASGDQEEAM